MLQIFQKYFRKKSGNMLQNFNTGYSIISNKLLQESLKDSVRNFGKDMRQRPFLCYFFKNLLQAFLQEFA